MFETLLSKKGVGVYQLEDGKKMLYNIQLSDEPETFEISMNYHIIII